MDGQNPNQNPINGNGGQSNGGISQNGIQPDALNSVETNSNSVTNEVNVVQPLNDVVTPMTQNSQDTGQILQGTPENLNQSQVFQPSAPMQNLQENSSVQSTLETPETVNSLETNSLGSVDLGGVASNPEIIPDSTPTPVEFDQNGDPTVVNPSGQTVSFSSTTPMVDPLGGQENQSSSSQQTADMTMGTDPMTIGNINGFVETKNTENIGTMPPSSENNKKKPMNKVLFAILIVVLIAGVAFGVYYYLSISKTKISVTPKTGIILSIGDSISSDPSYYANISGTNPSNCTVDTSEIKAEKAGEYNFTVKCNDQSYKGKVVVQDGEGPQLNVKVVYKTVGSSISKEEFYSSCEDTSGCTVEFADEAEINNNLQSAGGPYNVALVAKDSNGNVTNENAILYVTTLDVKVTTGFVEANINQSVENATKTVMDKLKFGYEENTGIVYLNAGRKEYIYEFKDNEAYKNAIGDKKSTITFDGVTGLASYDDNARILTISAPLDFNPESLNLSNNYTDINNYYMNLGYTFQPITNE